MCFIFMHHVLLFSSEEDKRYLMSWLILVSGIFQTPKKRENISLCILPSIGNSPNKKWIAGVGAHLLRWRKDLRIFLWKTESGSSCWDLRAKEDNPDLSIGQAKVLNKCIFTRGLRMHLNAKAGPSIEKMWFLAFFILSSMFFSSCLVPLTICPRWSLFRRAGRYPQ